MTGRIQVEHESKGIAVGLSTHDESRIYVETEKDQLAVYIWATGETSGDPTHKIMIPNNKKTEEHDMDNEERFYINDSNWLCVDFKNGSEFGANLDSMDADHRHMIRAAYEMRDALKLCLSANGRTVEQAIDEVPVEPWETAAINAINTSKGA